MEETLVEAVDLGGVLWNAEGFAMVGRRLVVWAWVRLGVGVWKKKKRYRDRAQTIYMPPILNAS